MMDDQLRQPDGPPPHRLPADERWYVVGDVHGHLRLLEAAHARIRADLAARPAARPRLLHLGDVIDRGPDSAGCIERLSGPSPLPGVPCLTLRGNHEQLMLRALDGERQAEIDLWLDNGGDLALESWGVKSSAPREEWRRAIPARHLRFLHDLPLSHRAGIYLFVHAGVRPGVAFKDQRPQDLLWIRDVFLRHRGPLLPEAPWTVVVHGHTPAPAPEVTSHRINLDTGAGKGGPLTFAILEGDEVRTVEV